MKQAEVTIASPDGKQVKHVFDSLVDSQYFIANTTIMLKAGNSEISLVETNVTQDEFDTVIFTFSNGSTITLKVVEAASN
jgi:hypothetical protein